MARQLILCIDDDPDILYLHKIILERAGYTVLGASAASQAMELFRSSPVDLVISDHVLPGPSGGDLIKQMKTLKPDVPVMMLSGLVSLPEGEQQHADVFLPKIDGTQELLRTVAEMLARRQRKQSLDDTI